MPQTNKYLNDPTLSVQVLMNKQINFGIDTFKIYFAIETVDTSINPFGVHHKLPVYPVNN